jgi:hypothetical protein
MKIPNAFLFVAGQTSPEDALSAADYPASGSYIDVTGYQWVNIPIHLGAINASDVPVFEVKCSDATNGTADSIDTTYCQHTCAHDDDDEMITFAIEVAKLPADHHFLTVTVSGVTNGTYGDILFLLGPARHQPVTQTTALLPTASIHEFAG